MMQITSPCLYCLFGTILSDKKRSFLLISADQKSKRACVYKQFLGRDDQELRYPLCKHHSPGDNDDNDDDDSVDNDNDVDVHNGGEDADGVEGDHVLETECSEWRVLYPLCKHHQTALVALCAAFATRRNCHSMKTNLVICHPVTLVRHLTILLCVL